LINDEDRNLLKKWLEKPCLETVLLMRATRDGDNQSIFKELCGNNGPLIVIIQTEDGKTFGGCSAKKQCPFLPDDKSL
jgi:hypothetical protein